MLETLALGLSREPLRYSLIGRLVIQTRCPQTRLFVEAIPIKSYDQYPAPG